MSYLKTGGPSTVGRPIEWRARRASLLVGFALIAGGFTSARAQLIQDYAGTTQQSNTQQSTPYGSPLGGGYSSNGTNGYSNGAGSNGSSNGQPGADLSRSQGFSLQPVQVERGGMSSQLDSQTLQNGSSLNAGERVHRVPPAPPNEFETYTARVLGRAKPIPRFGASLMVPEARDFALPPVSAVPASYVLNPGDTITLLMTGSVEGDLSLTVNNDGRIAIPRVGSVRIAGVRYGDLRATLQRAIGTQFRDFRVTPGIERLRGIRVYVTGYANNPGAFVVNGLSTMANAVLAAGGPSSGGSFRSIKLYRSGRLVSNFDLYDLIRNGDRSKDTVLQNEDVIRIEPVGSQVAIVGSVNAEAIYEARPGETLADLMRYGGGLNGVADQSRVMLYSLSNLDARGSEEVAIRNLQARPARAGDIVQALSIADLSRPLANQAVLVKLEGEVARPGNYYVEPGTPLSVVLQQAGGLTARAFVYGIEFDRVSVRQQQRKGFQEALGQLELSLAAAPLRSPGIGQDATQQDGQLNAARAVIERLRLAEPSGRVILDIASDATVLPELALENNDRVYIPPRPTTAGVFGAVYRPGSFQLAGKRRIGELVSFAGGPIREADQGRIFVVHANGQVVPRNKGALGKQVLPGDVIFVPIKTRSTSILPIIRDITGTLLSVGLTAAAVASLTN